MRALLADGSGELVPFSVSHAPEDAKSWIELLINGLTFDLIGLSSAAKPVAKSVHQFGVDIADEASLHELQLKPGPHIASAATLPGVLMGQLQLLSALSRLPGVRAIGWRPADSLMSADYFRRIVKNWSDGGPFPALGLAALEFDQHDVLRSVGLSYVTGQEIEIAVENGGQSAAAKLAVRVIDFLVETGLIDKEHTVPDPIGGYVLLSPEPSRSVVRVLK